MLYLCKVDCGSPCPKRSLLFKSAKDTDRTALDGWWQQRAWTTPVHSSLLWIDEISFLQRAPFHTKCTKAYQMVQVYGCTVWFCPLSDLLCATNISVTLLAIRSLQTRVVFALRLATTATVDGIFPPKVVWEKNGRIFDTEGTICDDP